MWKCKNEQIELTEEEKSILRHLRLAFRKISRKAKPDRIARMTVLASRHEFPESNTDSKYANALIRGIPARRRALSVAASRLRHRENHPFSTKYGTSPNDSVELHGFTFLGCTLWTDFALRGDPVAAMETAAVLMNDYKTIRNSVEGRPLLPRDTVELHRYSRAWLGSKLAESDRTKTIIVTHHAPSDRSEPRHHLDSPLAPAFSSALDEAKRHSTLDSRPQPPQCGLYARLHAEIFKSANQRGYPNQLCTDFIPSRTVEV